MPPLFAWRLSNIRSFRCSMGPMEGPPTVRKRAARSVLRTRTCSEQYIQIRHLPLLLAPFMTDIFPGVGTSGSRRAMSAGAATRTRLSPLTYPAAAMSPAPEMPPRCAATAQTAAGQSISRCVILIEPSSHPHLMLSQPHLILTSSSPNPYNPHLILSQHSADDAIPLRPVPSSVIMI